MKLLNLDQPWATLLVRGVKQFETRAWPTGYRGPVLVHANKRPMDREAKELAGLHLAENDLYFGGIIGVAWLSDCVPVEYRWWPMQRRAHSITGVEESLGCFNDGRYFFKFASRCEFARPVPHRSRQGMMLPAPPDIMDKLSDEDRLRLKDINVIWLYAPDRGETDD
jgi:hypothetical protein